MPFAHAAASEPTADRAARGVLAEAGTCVDAVVAAFFAAAGADPAVLLCPTVALVAGGGSAVRCFDGRPLQPGAGQRRPRGFCASGEIPAGAFVAAPRSLAVMSLLHAYGGTRPLPALARLGVKEAGRVGAGERAAFLTAVARRGAAALLGSGPLRALLRAGGVVAGGILSETDLREAVPGDVPAPLEPVEGELGLALVPWCRAAGDLRPSGQREPGPGSRARDRIAQVQVVVAADRQGGVAALAFAPDPGGVSVPELGLVLGRDAEPVRRGVSRVTPRTPRPSPAPIAILARPRAGWFAALGLSGAASIDAAALAGASGALRGRLERLRQQSPESRAFAASVQRGRTALCAVPSRAA